MTTTSSDDSAFTCWSTIRAAADGDPQAASEFFRSYESVVKAYFIARWHHDWRCSDIEDAVQDVFVECFKPNGALSHAESERVGGFRAFLFGITRNVALRYEARRLQHPIGDAVMTNESSLGMAFDREYARAIMKAAGRHCEETAKQNGAEATKRFELLRLRFDKRLPIRAIAQLWNEDPVRLHHEYAIARSEFRTALESVVRFHMPKATAAEVTSRCTELIELLKPNS